MNPGATVRQVGRIGESDCEALLEDVALAQPANAVSSVAYVAAGLWLLARATRHGGAEARTQAVYGLALTSVGVGSIAFHGPQPAGARLVHDLTIAAVFAVVAGRGARVLLGRSEQVGLLIAAGLTAIAGVVMAARPDAGPPVNAVLAGSAVAMETRLHWTGRRPRRARLLGVAAGALVAGGVVNALGRTGGPWCDPTSLFQGHAMWHLLTAAALGLYGLAAFGDPRRDG